MGSTQLGELVGAAVRPRAAVVAATAWGEGTPVLHLASLRGRAAKGPASLGPFAAVERLASGRGPALGGGAAANSGRSSKPRGAARSSASSLASTTVARAITLAGRPASFATWIP